MGSRRDDHTVKYATGRAETQDAISGGKCVSRREHAPVRESQTIRGTQTVLSQRHERTERQARDHVEAQDLPTKATGPSVFEAAM